MKKPKKMKPVKAWAIVHDNGDLAMPWGVHATFNVKRYAQKARKNYGAPARVARVEIHTGTLEHCLP